MPKLKEHRRRAVLSTRELAAKAEVSPATIWRIERGDVANIRPTTMRAIARVLGVQPSSIDEFARVIVNNGRYTDGQSEVKHDLAALAAQQHVRPILDPNQLVGDFWPEQEPIEDFVSTLYRWRQEENSNKELE